MNYNLDRFLEAQARFYNQAEKELRNGHKDSCWIWFIFPQERGLGRSPMSNYFGLEGVEEAKAYYENDLLRERLLHMCDLLLAIRGKSIQDIVAWDDIKVRSCMEIFYEATGNQKFKDVLDKYFFFYVF